MALPLVVTAFSGAISYIVGKIGTDLPFKIAMWAFLIFVVGIFIGFVGLVINAGFTVYHTINNLLSYIQSGSVGGGVMSNFYGVISCSGVLGGINATKGLVLSALVFRILYFGGKHFISFFKFAYHAFYEAIGAKLV